MGHGVDQDPNSYILHCIFSSLPTLPNNVSHRFTVCAFIIIYDGFPYANSISVLHYFGSLTPQPSLLFLKDYLHKIPKTLQHFRISIMY